MTIDDRRLNELIAESQDLQTDALRDNRAVVSDLQDLQNDRRKDEIDPAAIARFNVGRRNLIRNLGLGMAAKGVLATGMGGVITSVLAQPAAADKNLDVSILQTASSLEKLAVATYEAALTLPFIKDGNKTVVAFAQTTMKQHEDHRQAFIAQTKALGGKPQEQPNPKYKAIVDKAVPTLKSPLDVAKLAATLEKVATDTYLFDLTQFEDKKSMEIMGSVMGVEAQHLATLRAVIALLEANAPQLIAIDPGVLAKLPAAAGSVAFPEAFEKIPKDNIAEPESGAVK